MDVLYDSDCYSNYQSDHIDSETEVMLYSAIHHSFASEDQQLTSESRDWGLAMRIPEDAKFASSSLLASSLSATKLNEQKESLSGRSEQRLSDKSQMKTNPEKPLTNIFALLDRRLDVESDEEVAKDVDTRPNKNINKRSIKYIEISDSSDDSDVMIIDDDSPVKSRTKPKNPFTAKLKSPKVSAKANISLGNVNNLNESTLSQMDHFYNEDSYDSAEEARNYKRMSSDRRDWKISYTDTLVSNNRTNRYYKNRFLCHNCNERGHHARDCPLPKVCYPSRKKSFG